MGSRAGTADLPLHGGRVPEWLAARMARLGSVIVDALVLGEGPHGVLRRLAHPFWFQALGAVMGMDWHSLDSPDYQGAEVRWCRWSRRPAGVSTSRACAGRAAQREHAIPRNLLAPRACARP
jgi:hypothetical protein